MLAETLRSGKSRQRGRALDDWTVCKDSDAGTMPVVKNRRAMRRSYKLRLPMNRSPSKRFLRWITTVAFLLFLPAPAAPASIMNVKLKPETVEAFNRYVQTTEARVDAEMKRPGESLYLDGLPEAQRSKIRGMLKSGQVYMQPLVTREATGEEITAPDALIHHWLGAVFIPGAKLGDVISVVQDYNHHQDFYKPEVVRSRLISHEGNDFKIYYRLRKHQVITVTLDTDHDVHYFPVDATHEYSRSISTRIQEVANADEKNEYDKPVGKDGGFLWRMDSWWRFEESDGGVWVECESVSLTRDIPTGLGWLIKPFVTSIPRASLQMTMSSTRAAVLKRMARGERPAPSSPPRTHRKARHTSAR